MSILPKLITNLKTVYSLRVRNILAVQGFKYLEEVDNPRIPGFKCWLYEATPEFLEMYDRILTEDQRSSAKED